MILNYKNSHPNFKLNGSHFSHENLLQEGYRLIKEGEPYEEAIGEFLLDWLNTKNYILINTSGSTGTPKAIRIEKQAMVNSAVATGHFFKLLPKNKALHCLPTQYVAGKMMLVRAIILGLELDLVKPTSEPELNSDVDYDFCAMIPLQLQNSIEKCNHIKTIIVGGASVSNNLKRSIQNLESYVYETYGMTETVTHIALKPLNKGDKSYFKILPNVSITQDGRDCLVIHAPNLSKDKIITNDIVKIHSKTEFEWLGRYDNVINSGGVKLFPEKIEAKLQDKIKERFFIASEAHKELGEQVILILEKESNDQLNENIFLDLEKYEKPKKVYAIKKFKETSSGKVQRKETLKLLQN